MKLRLTARPCLWPLAITFGAALSGCSGTHSAAPPAERSQSQTVPQGSEAELVQRGKLIFDQTPKYASAYVGNKMACGDCHIDSGKAPYSAPMVDLASLFPMFNKRAGRVISLQERFQECFTRSENGRPLPEDSAEMKALTAYVDSLSGNGVKGKPYSGRGFVKLPDLNGHPEKGQLLYAAQCAGCHGRDGAGIPPVLPPVWGPNSYNDGAGMNNPNKMAAFLIHNMPQNHPGALTPQDAYDVAAFIHSMPRPKFNDAYKGY